MTTSLLILSTIMAVGPMPATEARTQDERPASRPADLATMTAGMPDSTLAHGEEYTFQVDFQLADGWSTEKAGIPKAFLQIEVPDGVRLVGKVLTSPREQARNEFLQQPFERVVDPGRTDVKFTVEGEVRPGAAFGLNVIAYVRRESDGRAEFIRLRTHLPVTAGATGIKADPANSDWGGEPHADIGGLQIGDAADSFELPRGDGTTISLDELRADGSNVLITTYRAFW